jgi:lycopene cyclase CruP
MYDVVVAGGTLGVFMATALAVRGWRVAVVERGKLQGRKQVWHSTEQPSILISNTEPQQKALSRNGLVSLLPA